MKVKLEDTVFVFERAYGDRVDGHINGAEPLIRSISLFGIIIFAFDDRIGSEFVLKQPQRAIKAGVWPDDAGNSQTYRLEAAQIMAGIIHVEQHFGQREFTGACLFESNQGQRVDLAQRNRLRYLVVVAALFPVRRFELLEADIELLTGI